ncbi:CrcB family protein [Ornithinimicrobium humiphilum]|uniref:Fluoride-specific ion channel FluC n=1 Tax=Ornithinimicrobium humiphilum TaxID=125288 RepID=A0A543KKP0_9MICO|nr:CrcB family protein [Ornithinimicrobium humiphilum]TQM95634.1 camphor resistance protein CrcB [Ornithinimicrobium humiphilum]
MLPDPRILSAVALGGAVGSLLRWGVEGVLPAAEGGLPVATLLVNVVGSLLIGALAVLLAGPSVEASRRAFWTTGLLGGFTTFSTFAVQVAALGAVAPATALLYTLLTPVLCVGCAWLGGRAVRREAGA